MTIPEVEESLQSMVILVDSREQDTPRSRARYEQFGVPYERKTIHTGDYSAKFLLPDGTWYDMSNDITVERKMNLDELCLCFGAERKRFIKEFERLKESNIRMWLLVEEASFMKAYNGKYRSQLSSKSLIASILAFQARYNTRIVMCDTTWSGKLIHDILYYEGREILMGMVDE